MNLTKLLIVDDDTEICHELSIYLKPRGFELVPAHDGKQMWQCLGNHLIKLIILDIMLPGTDGINLCQQIREKSSLPIIMLSAAGSEADRVFSLEVGADDFIAKPFSARELLARIKALLRRTEDGELGQARFSKFSSYLPIISFANWRFDRARRCLIDINDINISLSQREFQILTAFIENPKRILTRDILLEITRGLEATPFDRSIDVLIARLRKKIEIDPKNPQVISTVRSGGYQFNADINVVMDQ
ncbi:MAG: response regulator transcription factor [Pseudomonadota bacterium]